MTSYGRFGVLLVFGLIVYAIHIALIAGILVSLLRVLRVPRRGAGLVAIPLIWFYTAATGWQASAVRSTIMMTIVIAGWALKRPSHLLNSLAAAGLIILMWDPAQFFQAGFQLSFFVVLGIALIVPPLERVLQRALQPDPLLPPDLRPKWQRWLDLPVRTVTMSLATSLAAWLGSMPLIAWYFYMITPGSLLANLLIVPLSSLALMSTLGSLICGEWAVPLTILFNHSSWFWMLLMVRLSEWFASLPGAWFYVPRPSIALSGLYYALLGAILSGIAFAPRWRCWTFLGAGVLAAASLAVWLNSRNEIRLTVLPVPTGALYVDEPGRRHDLLVDCGNATACDSIIKPFLRSQGVNRLAWILLTHGDVAHTGGTELLREHFGVQRIFTSAASFRSRVYRDLIARLKTASMPSRQVQRGDAIGRWSVLHPAAEDRFTQGANQAMVLRGELHGTKVLLLSDLGRLGQRALLGREPELAADVVIAGLASEAEAVTESLLRTVNPQLLVVAGAQYPASSAPSRGLRERLSKLGIPVIYTSDEGAVLCTFGRGGCRVTTMEGRSQVLRGIGHNP